MYMDREMYIQGLAWDCVAAGQKPPLHPTTCAIIRLVALLGAARFSQLCDVIPCSEDAVKQQLSRLVRAGVLEKRYAEDEAGERRKFYVLSAGGVRMVLTWRREHGRVLEKLRSTNYEVRGTK